METSFTFTVDKAQITSLCKKQTAKATKMLLIAAIIMLFLCVLLVVCHFLFKRDYAGYIVAFILLDLFDWLLIAIYRRAAPKNAENLIKYFSVDGVITYNYEICATEFVVSQPELGNVTHYKYDILQKVMEFGDCVAVMLNTNQFLPIPVTEHTAPLIATLKSLVPTVKK